MRGWKMIFQANGSKKKAGVVILILHKIDIKLKKLKREKDGHYIVITKNIINNNLIQ